MSPLEKVVFDVLALHWMSAITGVCTCGEVMYVKGDPGQRSLGAVVEHRARVAVEAMEAAGYGTRRSARARRQSPPLHTSDGDVYLDENGQVMA